MTAAMLMFVFLLPKGAAAQTAAHVTDNQTPQTQARPTPPPPPKKKLPGSKIGYIDDSTIRTQVRFRFDVGYHNAFPDRAELFYAKCGCDHLPGNSQKPNFDPDASGPQPGVPSYLNFQQFYFNAEAAIGNRVAFFADVPVRWLQPFGPNRVAGALFSSASGLSDVSAGVKLGLVSTDPTSVTVQVQGHFATGDPAKGLGTDHSSVETSLLFRHQPASRLAFEGEIGDWHPIGGSAGVPLASQVSTCSSPCQPATSGFAGDVIFYGIGPSVELFNNGRVSFAPVVELVGWYVVSGFQTDPPTPLHALDVSGMNIVNLKIGARTTFNDRASVYFGYGHALTSDSWYQDIARFEFRYSF